MNHMNSNGNSDGSQLLLHDLLDSISSLSKISKSSNSQNWRTSNGYGQSNPSNSCFSTQTSSSEECLYESSPYRYSSKPSPQTRGMGRGHYINSLEARYAKGEIIAERDKRIHDELQQINGLGYSNDKIEERFGTPTDYFSFLTKKNQFENAIPENTSKKDSIDSTKLTNCETFLVKDESDPTKTILVEEGSDPIETILQTMNYPKLSTDTPVNNSTTLSDGETSLVKEGSDPTETILQTTSNPESSEIQCIKSTNSSTSEVPVSSKKKRQRKCRNLVVLSLTSEINKKLKPPDAYLASSPSMAEKTSTPWMLENVKDSIFSSEEFPAL